MERNITQRRWWKAWEENTQASEGIRKIRLCSFQILKQGDDTYLAETTSLFPTASAVSPCFTCWHKVETIVYCSEKTTFYSHCSPSLKCSLIACCMIKVSRLFKRFSKCLLVNFTFFKSYIFLSKRMCEYSCFYVKLSISAVFYWRKEGTTLTELA